MTNNFLPKLVKWYAKDLLIFLQKNPNLEVAWVDFLKWKKWYPFLWQIPTARLSELLWHWLVTIVWKRKWKQAKTQPMNLYKINENWLNFKF